MAYSECLPTRLNPLAERTSFSQVVVDTFFVCDLGVQSHTYYMSGRSGQWVSNFKKIRRRYFKGWFIVDFVAVFPLDYGPGRRGRLSGP
jgi:hypothetical protein